MSLYLRLIQHDQCLNENLESVAATFYYIILHVLHSSVEYLILITPSMSCMSFPENNHWKQITQTHLICWSQEH